MKKRTVKKVKLRKGIKTALVIIGIYGIITIYLLFASNRIESIENNTKAYTESGHAHSVQVNLNK